MIVAADHVAAVQALLQFFDGKMAVDEPAAVGARQGFRTFAAAQFGKLPRDCFQDVDRCGDAFDLAVLISDDRQVRARFLKLVEQLQNRERIRDMQGWLQVPIGIQPAPMDRFAQVGQRDHSEQIVELAARHEKARMATFLRLVP